MNEFSALFKDLIGGLFLAFEVFLIVFLLLGA